MRRIWFWLKRQRWFWILVILTILYLYFSDTFWVRIKEELYPVFKYLVIGGMGLLALLAVMGTGYLLFKIISLLNKGAKQRSEKREVYRQKEQEKQQKEALKELESILWQEAEDLLEWSEGIKAAEEFQVIKKEIEDIRDRAESCLEEGLQNTEILSRKAEEMERLLNKIRRLREREERKVGEKRDTEKEERQNWEREQKERRNYEEGRKAREAEEARRQEQEEERRAHLLKIHALLKEARGLFSQALEIEDPHNPQAYNPETHCLEAKEKLRRVGGFLTRSLSNGYLFEDGDFAEEINNIYSGVFIGLTEDVNRCLTKVRQFPEVYREAREAKAAGLSTARWFIRGWEGAVIGSTGEERRQWCLMEYLKEG